MAVVNCPHCQNGITNDPRLAGQVVSCPHCSKQFRMPAAVSVLPPPTPAVRQPQRPPGIHVEDQQRPVNILVNTSDTRPRLEAGGWFSRSFSSASGVLLALLLFTVLLVGVPVVLVCGGCLTLLNTAGKVAEKVSEERKSRTEKAKKFAMQHLQQRGIEKFSDGTGLVETLGETSLVGEGMDSTGRLHDIIVSWKVAEFGKTEQWELKQIIVDNEMIFDAESR
jgi:hypothetical protein